MSHDLPREMREYLCVECLEQKLTVSNTILDDHCLSISEARILIQSYKSLLIGKDILFHPFDGLARK